MRVGILPFAVSIEGSLPRVTHSLWLAIAGGFDVLDLPDNCCRQASKQGLFCYLAVCYLRCYQGREIRVFFLFFVNASKNISDPKTLAQFILRGRH